MFRPALFLSPTHLARTLVLTTAMAVMIGSSSRADVLTWDADAGTAGNQDGAGTWMVAQPNWFNGTTSTANQNWVDGSDAIFGVGSGAAGAVTLGGPITVGALTFDPTGSGAYTLSGDVLTLTGGVTMNAAATIQSVLAGSAGLNLSGSQMLTLSGGSANTYTGTTTIDGGATLMLSRTAGVTAVTGDISITNGGRLRMSAADQIDDGATVTMSGATSVFNGSAPNNQPSNLPETFANLLVTGGAVNGGASVQGFTVTGTTSYTGGAGNTTYVGNSGSTWTTNALILIDMTDTAGGTPAKANTFTVYGNSASRQSFLNVGSGGILLNNSRLNMRYGNRGSRLTVDGTIATAGSAKSSILIDTNGGTTGVVELWLSSTAAAVDRTFDVAGGGADLDVGVSMVDGASAAAGIVKTGAGTLTLNGTTANGYTGMTTINEGTLLLNKTAGVAAVAGDITINSGGTLRFGTNGQTAATTSITVDGGSVASLNTDQIIANYTQNSGGLASGGNTGDLTVTGTMTLNGGNQVVINSSGPASWDINRLEMNGANVLIGGSNGVGNPKTMLTIGAGGLVMDGRLLTMNFGNAGVQLNLNGDVSMTNGSQIDTGGSSGVAPVVEIGAATRTFTVLDGVGQVDAIVQGTGGLIKDGPGALYLTRANTYSGSTTVQAGELWINGGAGTASNTSDLAVVGGGSLIDGSSSSANNDGVTDRINPSATLTLGDTTGGGSFSLLTPASGAHLQTLDSVTIAAGSNSVSAIATPGTTTTLTFAGSSPYNYVSGSVNFEQNPADGGSIIFTNAPAAGSTSGGVLKGATLNSTDLVAAQSGVLTAFTGWIDTGTTVWTSGASMNVTGSNPTPFSSTNINALRYDDAAAHTITLTGTHGIDSGMILVTPNVGANDSTLTGGTIQGAAGDALRVSQFNTAGDFIIGSNIQDNTAATGLVKTGAGALVLTGTNSYTGDTIVRDGVLRAEDGVGLPSGSNLQVLENGLFESTGASFTRALGTAAGEVQVLNGVAGFGASGTAVAVNLGGAGGTVTWGSASFAPTEFVLNGATSDGTIDFQNGLDLNGAMRTVRVDADPAAAATISGVIDGGADAGLVKAGTGTLILSGTNTLSGRVVADEGALGIANDAAFGTAVLELAGAAISAEGAARTVSNAVEVSADTTFTGTQSLELSGVVTNTTTTPNLTNSISGGVLTLSGTVYGSDDDVSTGHYFEVSGSGDTVISGVLANNAYGNTTDTGLFYNGNGSLTLGGANTYSGRTLIAGSGYVAVSADENLGTAPSSPVTDSIILAAGGRLRATETFTLDPNRGIGIGNSGGGGTTGRIEVDANKELTVPGVIADRTMNVDGSSTGLNTGAALSKLGNGALTLSGDNTYTGTTYVSDGILRVASDMALGTTDGGTVVSAGAHLALADGVVITGETLTLNGGGGTTGPGSPISNRGDLQADIGASAEWAGDVIINSNLARIGVQEGGSILVSGDIDDLGAGHTVRLSGELTRTGGVTLSGSNSWGGSTDVVRGTVYLGADNTLPTTSPLNIHYSSSNNSEYALVDLSGFDQTVSALQNTGNSGANAELTNSNCLDTSVFTVNQAVDGAFNGIITGNLTLVKEGAGILTLAGPNTYTGGTVINEGGLRGSGAGAFGENDLAVNGGASSGGYIDLNGSSLVVNALNGVSGLVNGVIANDSTTLAENALIVGVNHGTGTYAASLVDNTGGSAQGILGVTKIGTGTQTLSGANTYTGTTAVAEGTLIFDHSSATPIGTGPIKLEGGELSFKGSGSLSVGEMTLVQTSTAYNTNTVRVQDGGTVTTTNLAGSGFSPLLVDLRGGGTLVATTLNGINATNGILTQGSLNRATLYVQDDSGIGFATQNGSNEIVRYTGGTALTASNSSGTTNFVASSNVTRTAALSYYTLQLDSSSSAVTLDVGANNVNAASSGRGILFTGDNDSTITGTTGKFVGSSIFIANQGLGTATIGISLAGNASIFSGSGLVVYDHADNPADLYVANGVVRLAGGDRTYSGNLTRIYGGGVLELGGDQNGATDGDFTRSVVAASGGVVLLGSGGFSAHGADRVVALGGVGSADALTWGAGNFLAGAEGDGNHAFKLGSASSTHTLEFQNNIDLGSRLRVIDVADGVDSTNIDGRLTGVLSGAGGGLWKRGDGALELTGANTYSGVTDIEAGTVQVSSGATTGTGEVTVRSGATLQGAGTVLGAHVSLESGATLRAGDGAAATDLGTLTFAPEGCAAGIDLQGSVILGIAGATNAGSVDPFFGGNAIGSPGYLTYINDISRSQGAGDHDLLSFAPSASGDLYNVDFLTTSGTLKVEDGGLVPMTGQIFNLLDWSGLSNGTPNFTGFDIGSNLRTGNDLDANEGGLDLPDLSSYGLLWDVSQFTTTGIVVIVPEPGRGLLILVAVLMGCTQRRRRGGR